MAKRERFSAPPVSLGIRAPKPRLSMVDRQIIALRQEREREAMSIKTREELYTELTDFSYLDPVDEYGLPLRTPYQVPENIPDVLPLPQKDTPEETTEPPIETPQSE